MKPKISIIIPVFNRESLIKATIDSIKAQSYRDFECLLIDDHSSDNTVNVMEKVVEDDVRFKVLKRQPDYLKGPSGCRNMGLDIATGTYIQFFDSDDLMHPDHLKLKIEAYSENIDLVVCKLGEFKDNDPKILFSISDIDDKGKLISHISGEVNYYLPGPMWKRKVIGDDRFHTDIKIYEDLLFNLINRKKCSNIHLIDNPLIYYRRHEDSTTGIATKNVALLEQKRLAWKYMYEVMTEDNPSYTEDKNVRSYFFDRSCLNLYYILSQQSLILGLRHFKDIFFYASSLKHFIIIIKLIISSPLAYFFSKGYKLFKVKT